MNAQETMTAAVGQRQEVPSLFSLAVARDPAPYFNSLLDSLLDFTQRDPADTRRDLDGDWRQDPADRDADDDGYPGQRKPGTAYAPVPIADTWDPIRIPDREYAPDRTGSAGQSAPQDRAAPGALPQGPSAERSAATDPPAARPADTAAKTEAPSAKEAADDSGTRAESAPAGETVEAAPKEFPPDPSASAEGETPDVAADVPVTSAPPAEPAAAADAPTADSKADAAPADAAPADAAQPATTAAAKPDRPTDEPVAEEADQAQDAESATETADTADTAEGDEPESAPDQNPAADGGDGGPDSGAAPWMADVETAEPAAGEMADPAAGQDAALAAGIKTAAMPRAGLRVESAQSAGMSEAAAGSQPLAARAGGVAGAPFQARLQDLAAEPGAHEVVTRIEKMQDLAQRIDEHALAMARGDKRDMLITIVPEKLGKLIMRCREEEDGLRVQVQAGNDTVTQMLRQHEAGLRRVLEQSGFKLSQFDVTSSGGDADRGRAGQQPWPDETADRPGWTAGQPAARAAGGAAAPAEAPAAVRPARKDGIWLVA